MSRQKFRSFSGWLHFGLTISLVALICAPSVIAADSVTLPIKKISADTSQQLVVEFAGGSFPATPQVLDLPGPNHRVVIDFSDSSIDRSTVLSQEDLSKSVSKSLPFIKSLRYSNMENTPKPTVRLVVDLPEDVKIKPRVVKLEEGIVVIGFSDQPIQLPTEAAVTPPTANDLVVKDEFGGWQSSSANKEAANSQEKSDEVVSSADKTVEQNVANQSVLSPAALPPAVAPTPSDTTNTAAPAPVVSAPAPAATVSPADTELSNKKEAIKRYNKAVQLHLSGKLPEAIVAYKDALEVNSSLAEAHSNLGLIFNQQHNYAQALVEFRKALAVNPKDAITYNGIGAALRAEKDLLGAIKNWQTAVSLDPKLATAHYNLGTAYEIQKEYDRALASYRSAVKNDFRLGEAYYRMGLIMERKHRSEEAAEQFKEALKVSADSEYSEDARQRLAFLQGKKATKN